MKFAFVFDGLGCGGIERVGIGYCNALVERGHEVTVINLVPSANEFVSQLSNKVIYIAKNFPRAAAPERYSTLVSRTAWGRYAYPAIYAFSSVATSIAKPCLRRGLGSYDIAIAFSGHFNDLTFAALGFVKARRAIAWLHGTINSYGLISDGYINLYKHFDKLVCLSDEGIEEFRSAKHWLNLPLVKLYNPIDLSCPGRDAAKSDGLRMTYGDYILMVARLASPKDPKTLIDAVALLKDKYGIEKNCVIVGDGPDVAEIQRYVADSSVSSLIHLVGYDNNPTPYFDACGVFVLSSLNEGLPTVLLEAMSLGKPVVATNVPGAREILEGGKDGLLCGIKDAENMAGCLACLYEEPAVAARYSELGLDRVKAFDKTMIIDRFLNLVVKEVLQ